MSDPRDLLAAGATLALDAAAVELVERLPRAILLRGPAIGRRLYPDGTRVYEDIDLLVSAADLREIERVLRAEGFELTSRDLHAVPWIRRRDGLTLDLHTTMIGVRVPAEDVWRELSKQAERVPLGRGEVDVLRPPGLALNVALHAAQHGVSGGKSLEDLARAVERLPESDWREAAALAERLDALGAFATGLRLLPAGADLAERLELPVERSAELALRAGSAPPTALGFWRLAETQGVGGKLSLLAHELAPSPAFMRAMYPIARWGFAGLAASYLWRPLSLARQIGPGFAAWRRARR